MFTKKSSAINHYSSLKFNGLGSFSVKIIDCTPPHLYYRFIYLSERVEYRRKAVEMNLTAGPAKSYVTLTAHVCYVILHQSSVCVVVPR